MECIEEILFNQILDRPIPGENVRRPAVNERRPFVLHVQCPRETFPKALLPGVHSPVGAILMQTQLKPCRHQLCIQCSRGYGRLLHEKETCLDGSDGGTG